MKKIYKKDGVFLVLQDEQFYAFSQGVSIVEEHNQVEMQLVLYWYDKLEDRLHSWPLAKPPQFTDQEVLVQPKIGPALRFLYINKAIYDSYIRERGILQEDAAPELATDDAVQQHMMSISAYQ